MYGFFFHLIYKVTVEYAYIPVPCTSLNNNQNKKKYTDNQMPCIIKSNVNRMKFNRSQ